MKLRPIHISVDNLPGVLNIQWDDGSECEYPFVSLRAACPCAECREGCKDLSGKSVSGELEIPLHSVQASKLERLEMVGNYALQLVWNDGHCYGIYPWDYLRELCPESNALKGKK